MVKPLELMIIGAPKSGTTSLLNYLAQHPDIHTHQQRELTFFLNDEEYTQGFSKTFTKYFGSYQLNKKVLLGKHVMIMYSRKASLRLLEHNPSVQLLVVLRNPVDRAYSAYWYARRRGWEDLQTFEKAIEMEPIRLRESWLKWRHCAYLYHGSYSQHIRRLFNDFNKVQVHVIPTEELHNNPQQVCKEIYNLFDLDTTFVPEVGKRHNKSALPRSELFARIFAGSISSSNSLKPAIRSLLPHSLAYRLRHTVLRLNEKEFTPPPIQPETRQHLLEYFHSSNAELSELIKHDLSHWNF